MVAEDGYFLDVMKYISYDYIRRDSKLLKTMIEESRKEFIIARLKLAQSLLEESDFLLRHIKSDMNTEKWWLHPIHEREALVSYLLLTCFDYLGQKKGYINFFSWLKSKKIQHVLERKDGIGKIPPDSLPEKIAGILLEHYEELYSVKNAFYGGIKNLPEVAKRKLLSSVSISDCPNYGSKPNTSFPSYPLEENEELEKIKLKYVYEKRNKFTHRLEQYQACSLPHIENCSRWLAEINNSKLIYKSLSNQESRPLKEGGAMIYSISGWPFILFEVIYMAIGINFDRTLINLRFNITLRNSMNPNICLELNEVEHARLKDYELLEKES